MAAGAAAPPWASVPGAARLFPSERVDIHLQLPPLQPGCVAEDARERLVVRDGREHADAGEVKPAVRDDAEQHWESDAESSRLDALAWVQLHDDASDQPKWWTAYAIADVKPAM